MAKLRQLLSRPMPAVNTSLLWRQVFVPGLILVGSIAFVAIAAACWINIVNDELEGRSIVTKLAQSDGEKKDEELPTVQLVLHRLPEGENAIEASLIIYTDNNLTEKIKGSASSYEVFIRDGNVIQPYPIQHSVLLNAETARQPIGVTSLGVQSERFQLPALQSIAGYPFDDLSIYPMIDVYNNGTVSKFHLKVEKALPGRQMRLAAQDRVVITLTRSSSERWLIVACSIIFTILSIVLSLSLLASPSGLTTTEELLAVAGYLLAASGFRDVLGFSRVAGVSVLEFFVIGASFVTLTTTLVIAFFRGKALRRNEEK